MIGVPTSLLGLLLFVVLLAPGFAYTLCRERLTAHRPVSAFRETVALVFVGVLCDAVALGVFAVLRVLGPGWTPDVGALLRDPQGYALRHYAELTAWSVGLLTLAVLLAVAAGNRWFRRLAGRLPWLRRRLPHREHEAYLSAWWLLFSEHPDSEVHVGCVLEDGSYVTGRLWSFSRSAEDSQDRELTLVGPIRYRAPRAKEAVLLPGVGAAAVSARRIVLLTVSYVTGEHDRDTAPVAD